MAVQVFQRSRRATPPALPRGDLALDPPPELPDPKGQRLFNTVLQVLPMLAGGAAMMLMMSQASGARGAMAPVLGGLYGLSMLGMLISQTGRGNDEQAQNLDASRRQYFRYLDRTRTRVREVADRQRAAVTWRHPDPAALWALAGRRRMWERRPSDDDFALVRVSVGSQQFAQRITLPEVGPLEDQEPLTTAAVRRFAATFRTVPSVPLALPLRSYASIAMVGDAEASVRLGYAMIAQLAAWHAPTDVRIAICVPPERRHRWDWAKWLPHAQHPERSDGVGSLRLIATSAGDLSQVLAGVGDGDQPPTHLVLVVDGVAGANAGSAVGAGTTVTTVDVGTSPGAVVPRRLDGGQLVLDVRPERLTVHRRLGNGQVGAADYGVPDQLAMVGAEMTARELSPWRMPARHQQNAVEDDIEEEGDVVFEAPRDYPAMVGVGDPITLDPRVSWRLRPLPQRLRVPVGNGEDGRPVELDIKEASLGGMGPHGLCIGATGSGKSEFLRTLVLGMAMTHASDQLNLVLVDFKGGATFLGLDELPHVSTVITNLEGELTLVDRMQDAIAGEMERRMEVLRAAGNYKNREDYDEARRGGADLEPMPSLFFVIDEFSELLAARPEFIDLFIQIGRIGRSIGVHLLLASQRLEESKLRGLDTFLSYRIALRTFSPQESRTVIGVPDAYELPTPPGNGYLKFDTTSMVRFKAAYVSGPWRSTETARPVALPVATTDAPATVVPVLEFTPGYVRPVEPPEPPPALTEDVAASGPAEGDAAVGAAGPEPAPLDDEREDDDREDDDEREEETLLDIVVDRLRGHGWPAHRVWLPPLDDPPTLDGLLGGLVVDEVRGLQAADRSARGRLRATMALVDRPRQQRRDALWVDLSGAAGHVAVVGGPQAGKSTALRSLMAGMALTHTPQEVGFYCLDFGGGSLASLRDLPHVGSVTSRMDVDRVRRTVAEFTSLLSLREAQFGELGVDGMSGFRRGRADGSIAADRFPVDVFLVIDGWLTLRQEFEELEQAVTQLAGRGLGFGIHVVVATNKWSELRANIRDLLQTRVELKLGDAYESEIDRRKAPLVPAGRPGRGLTADGLHMLVAVPRIDGVEDADDLAAGVRDLVSRVGQAWPGDPVAGVRMLPEDLPYGALPEYDIFNRDLPIGIDELELAPVWLRPDADPHFVAVGGPGSGKSTLLRSIITSIVDRYTPSEAKLLILDYRRSLIGLVEGKHLIRYLPSAAAANDVVKALGTSLRKRLPGPDVTQEQLRQGTWWSGSKVFVVVDDYELVASSTGHALQPLFDLVSQAGDIGLHIIIARGMGGAGRAVFSDPVITRMKEAMNPALVMSGTRDEGQLFGNIRPGPLPPGRGHLVTKTGTVLIQTANLPAAD